MMNGKHKKIMLNKILLSLLLITILCSSFSVENKIPVVKWDKMEALLNNKEDKVYVINFWATWCRPCLEELPDFEAFQKKYKKEDVEVILVSLDQKKLLETKVEPLIKKKGIISTVWLLDETNFNSWINKIDPSWSGAIPATLIIKGAAEKKIFHEGKYTEEKLNEIVEQL